MAAEIEKKKIFPSGRITILSQQLEGIKTELDLSGQKTLISAGERIEEALYLLHTAQQELRSANENNDKQ
ncbi:hypothetical protein A3D54_03930 [Candidatus Falkowbacteria bacterium RIFCSPHIGHO2_02_FULL_45_15]|uniref:Uncharacterized protein n=1 Tax=Candidatus Falkowbacteria bacterium RIFCSPHIGHO2_02_FULL_45_15 TaxID=1797987 RepID=A0A1F5S0A9_9BACT|nr:MAG: hypothetical protein A3D54_03930 [Candidatus Falkowbacteria bacterium RIFCSPHIGHO2_02_FULL_45_15]